VQPSGYCIPHSNRAAPQSSAISQPPPPPPLSAVVRVERNEVARRMRLTGHNRNNAPCELLKSQSLFTVPLYRYQYLTRALAVRRQCRKLGVTESLQCAQKRTVCRTGEGSRTLGLLRHTSHITHHTSFLQVPIQRLSRPLLRLCSALDTRAGAFPRSMFNATNL
jgi:hypothetical protein